MLHQTLRKDRRQCIGLIQTRDVCCVKALTRMSWLEFCDQLRLHEARRSIASEQRMLPAPVIRQATAALYN